MVFYSELDIEPIKAIINETVFLSKLDVIRINDDEEIIDWCFDNGYKLKIGGEIIFD
jgi:hypothetical protein